MSLQRVAQRALAFGMFGAVAAGVATTAAASVQPQPRDGWGGVSIGDDNATDNGSVAGQRGGGDDSWLPFGRFFAVADHGFAMESHSWNQRGGDMEGHGWNQHRGDCDSSCSTPVLTIPCPVQWTPPPCPPTPCPPPPCPTATDTPCPPSPCPTTPWHTTVPNTPTPCPPPPCPTTSWASTPTPCPTETHSPCGDDHHGWGSDKNDAGAWKHNGDRPGHHHVPDALLDRVR